MAGKSSRGPWVHIPRPGLVGRHAKTWCGLPLFRRQTLATKQCPQCARAAARGK